MATAFRSHNLKAALGILEGAMETSLKQGGQLLKQAMQARAPVWTGRMERSVHVGPVTLRDNAFRLRVGPTVGYAKFSELEPWIIGREPGPKSRIKGATIPWMAPAAEEVGPEVRDIIVGGVSATVRQLQQRYKGIG